MGSLPGLLGDVRHLNLSLNMSRGSQCFRVAGFLYTRLEFFQNTTSMRWLIVISALALASLAALNILALLAEAVLATHSSSAGLVHAPGSAALATTFGALAQLVVAGLFMTLLAAFVLDPLASCGELLM
jgi:hypothetical protein